MTVGVRNDLTDVAGGPLRIIVSEQGAQTTIGLEGEWSLAEREAIRLALRRTLARQPDALLLDLSRLTFIDSSGVHAVIDLAKRTERLGIRLGIVPGSRAVQRVFEICELTELLPFTTRM
jgi:anti-sigma B factor antagonist